MRVRFGTIALTSRMILGFAVASKASSLTLKTVFSFGFSYSGDLRSMTHPLVHKIA